MRGASAGRRNGPLYSRTVRELRRERAHPWNAGSQAHEYSFDHAQRPVDRRKLTAGRALVAQAPDIAKNQCGPGGGSGRFDGYRRAKGVPGIAFRERTRALVESSVPRLRWPPQNRAGLGAQWRADRHHLYPSEYGPGHRDARGRTSEWEEADGTRADSGALHSSR